MQKEPLRVAVTGPVGTVGYALVFRIASGQLLGPDQPVILHLKEIPPAMPALEGVAMELDDCAFPLLKDMVLTSSDDEAFDGVSWALLVGAMPRKEGMERRDLLTANGGIFGPMGKALGERAASDVRVLVVGNPCNTNCGIARASAPDIPDDRWFAMTRLDENRARTQLAKKAGVDVDQVTNVTIWGNHSATQYPDAPNAKIGGRPAPEVIGDDEWLRGEFIATVQKRGAAIIKARGASSAASAANAIIDCVNSIGGTTPQGDWTSVGIVSHGEYGVPEGLVFSYPVRFSGGGAPQVVEGLQHDGFARDRLAATQLELEDERNEVSHLLPA